MDLNEQSFQLIADFLNQTLSPDPNVRRPAEKCLEGFESKSKYGILLLMLCNREGVLQHIRVSAAITFKNFIKRNWHINEDGLDKITHEDRTDIKSSIVELMLTSPEQIQRQLSDAISIISKEDFPEKWENLLTDMVQKFNTGDFHIINGILRTAHSIFKRYRHEFQSNELWKEIKYVLSSFAVPFTNLFKELMSMVEKYSTDANALSIIFSSLVLVCKIFRSLNSQDLPEEFEDNITIWMSNFMALLVYDNQLLYSKGEEAGLLEQVKSQVCDNISLYAQNYSEEFGDYLPQFVSAVWNLLVTTSLDSKYDLLVSNAIQFLTAVVNRPQYRSLFEAKESLTVICEKIVIPNLFLRDSDIEIFEDNPEEYIRKDIEKSDADTRRRAASDLVQALCSQFEQTVVGIFSTYVGALLQEFSSNPQKKWREKDAALFLVTTLASRGQTRRHGTTKASELIDVVKFYESSVLPDLTDQDVNSFPVIKSDAIRYLAAFRQQLPKEAILSTLPYLIHYLTSNVAVVNTYAAHAIEKILTVKDQNNKDNLITKLDLKPHLHKIFSNMFNLLRPVTGENEYVMKAIMRVCVVAQEETVPYLEAILTNLTNILNAICRNPSKPHFNHYLFETYGVLIKSICSSNKRLIEGFERNLSPILNIILHQDITEFIPYALQLLSLMLEFNVDNVIPDVYRDLFPSLLHPILWERPGYIPALTRLFQAYIERGSRNIVAEKIVGVLGVFQRLIASKINDHYGFYILNSLIENMQYELIGNYITDIFNLLFRRLSNSRTTKFAKNMLVFLSLYCYKYGPTQLHQVLDNIQNGMYLMVIERLFVLDLQKVSGNLERKICAVGVTKILTENDFLVSTDANQLLWCQLLEALVKLFELPEDDSTPDDEHYIEIEDTPGYQTAYSQLAYAARPEPDPFNGEIPNSKIFLAKKLEIASKGLASRLSLSRLISLNLHVDVQNHLQVYFRLANTTLQ